jgi:SAM-dependent methyltransferase
VPVGPGREPPGAGHAPGPRWGPLGAACVLRPWSERLLDVVRPRSGERILDCPSDSGTLSRHLCRTVGTSGLVVAADPGSLPWPVARAAHGALPAARDLRVDPARLPLASGSLDAAVSLLTLHLAPDPAVLLAEMVRAVDPRHGRVAAAVQVGGSGSPHETAVAAVLGDAALPAPALPAAAAAGVLREVGRLTGEGPARLRCERWRDVVRFDGADQLWAALVTERGLDARLTGARRALLEAALDRWTAADGTLRIPVEAVLLSSAAW